MFSLQQQKYFTWIIEEDYMQTVFELCKPRDASFLTQPEDDVLNLSDLVEGRIDADTFFVENYKTRMESSSKRRF
jgi:hypothetical protein